MEVGGTDFFEEVVDFEGFVGEFFVDDGEGVEFDVVFFEEGEGSHDLVEGGGIIFVGAVEVVEFAWAVEGEADEEVVLVEEFGPVGVEEDAVGLEGVVDFFVLRIMFLLEFNDFFEEVESEECGFAALPGEVDFGDVLLVDVLLDAGFEGVVGHFEGVEVGVGWIKIFFFEVEAVFAVEVADRADGLGHDVEGARGGWWCGGGHEGSVRN